MLDFVGKVNANQENKDEMNRVSFGIVLFSDGYAGKLLFPLHGDDSFPLGIIEGGTGAFDANAIYLVEGL